MSVMVSFCAVLFPLDVSDEIVDLIESVSEGFPTYFSTPEFNVHTNSCKEIQICITFRYTVTVITIFLLYFMPFIHETF